MLDQRQLLFAKHFLLKRECDLWFLLLNTLLVYDALYKYGKISANICYIFKPENARER